MLQSRLFRTKDDIEALHAKPCKVRICIGIYKEPKAIAYQDKPAMKEKLFEYVQLLLDKGHYPEIATHDEPLIHRCLEYLDKRGCPKNAYEFQMLLGVPRHAIQTQIVDDRHRHAPLRAVRGGVAVRDRLLQAAPGGEPDDGRLRDEEPVREVAAGDRHEGPRRNYPARPLGSTGSLALKPPVTRH